MCEDAGATSNEKPLKDSLIGKFITATRYQVELDGTRETTPVNLQNSAGLSYPTHLEHKSPIPQRHSKSDESEVGQALGIVEADFFHLNLHQSSAEVGMLANVLIEILALHAECFSNLAERERCGPM